MMGDVPNTNSQAPAAIVHPSWFGDFLADRAVRKPSPHTIKAYRQDFEAIAILLAHTADAVAHLRVDELTKDTLRPAFATYAGTQIINNDFRALFSHHNGHRTANTAARTGHQYYFVFHHHSIVSKSYI